jgi:predicted Fe-Mo cluster-binding NifX family protein
MKIAVTAQEANVEAEVDPRFGRAKWFAIFDDQTKEFSYIANEQNLQAQQGAGVQAAQLVARQGAKAVITGHCGPKAFRALKAAEIEIFLGAEATVREVLELFRQGKLTASARPDVSGHWA